MDFNENTGIQVLDIEKTETKPRIAPRYKILLHDDPITPAETVIWILVLHFKKQQQEAGQIMLTAHLQGLSLVTGGMSLEQAEFQVEQAHSVARTHGYPLTFSIESE